MTELQESLKKCKTEGNVLFLPPVSHGMLPNYNEVKTALIKAGAKYQRNTFIFPNEAQPYIDRLMSGDKVNIKKEFQFFATPDKLADRLVELAEVKEKDLILEPSAGQGAIIKAINRVLPKKIVLCVELMDINRNILEKMPTANVMDEDFLNLRSAVALSTKFDKIIANPPFSKNQDIDHIRKMYECCKDGGRIVSIASKHWQTSTNQKETAFKEWLEELDYELYQIPAGEFKESGTNIATCIIVINK